MRESGIWLVNIVGLMGLVASVMGLFPLTYLFLHFQASPVPTVFGDANERATFARRFSVRVELASGATRDFGLDGTGFANALEGPFTRRKGYIDRTMFLDLGARHRTWSFVHFAFCEPGTLVEELALETPVRRVSVHVWSAVPAEDFDDTITVECQPH